MKPMRGTFAAVCVYGMIVGALTVLLAAERVEAGQLRAGAAAVDVSPPHLPVLINGGFTQRTADTVRDRLYARATVLDDGDTRLAVVVVDSCMMPRELLDEAKRLAAEATGIATDHMLISATHTHSAPSSMRLLGCAVDENYAPLLPAWIAEAIAEAADRLEPAEIGHKVIAAPEHLATRRWIWRPDVTHEDPFGEMTVQANMHPGHLNPDSAGPSGPIDDAFTVFAVRAVDGERPIALLGNYGLHYFGRGVSPVSADYFGLFARQVEQRLGHGEEDHPPFVAALSNGSSGDIWWKDYFREPYERELEEYTEIFVEFAEQAWHDIEYSGDLTLAMAEAKLPLDRRVPDDDRLAWAREIVEEVGDDPPRTRSEVYAFEQFWLKENPEAELKLQAVRIGDFAMTAIPNEVYAITGLKLKHHSPLQPVMNISLANGAAGYIPPPEQHDLGGYNTWPARSAGLEVEAEPKITETVIELLEQVADAPRRPFTEPASRYADHVLAAEPLAYWRMGEFAGPTAYDATAHGHDGTYERGVVFALPGPNGPGFTSEADMNRSPHFAGGRMHAALEELGETWSVEIWFWPGVGNDHYPVTGYLFSRGEDGADAAPGDHLGIGGTLSEDVQGRLFYYNGDAAEQVIVGETVIGERHTWHHAVLVRDGGEVRLYLDGAREATGEAAVTAPADVGRVFIGGRNDNVANFTGRLDEVAIHNRALTDEEVAARYRTATAD